MWVLLYVLLLLFSLSYACYRPLDSHELGSVFKQALTLLFSLAAFQSCFHKGAEQD